MTTTPNRKARRASIIALDAINPVNPEPKSAKKPSKDKLVERRSLYSIPGKQAVSAERITAALNQLNAGRFELWADVCTGALSDPIIQRAYYIRRAAVAGRPFTVSTPKDVDPKFKEDADRLALVVRNWLQNMDSTESFLMRVLDAIGPGVSCHELDWKLFNDLWLPTPTPVMTRELMYERDWMLSARNINYEYIRTGDYPGKFLVHNPYTDAARPIDQGCFRAAMWYYLFKTGAYSFYMTGAERYGNPIALAHMGPSSDANQRQKILEDLENLASDTVGVVAGVTSIEIIESKFQGAGAVWKDLVKLVDDQLLLAIGVSPDLIMSGPNGSRSSTETRDGVRLESSKMDARLMWSAINRDCVRWIAWFNGFGPEVPMPIIESVFEDGITIPADAIKAGLVTNNEYRRSIGLEAWPEPQGSAIASFKEDKVAAVPNLLAPQQPNISTVSGSL